MPTNGVVPTASELELYDERAGHGVLAVRRGTRLTALPGLPTGDWELVGEMTLEAVAGLMDTGAAEIEGEVVRQGFCLWE